MTENVSKGVIATVAGLTVGAVTETTYGGVIATVVGGLLSASAWFVLAFFSLDRRVKVLEAVSTYQMSQIDRRLENLEDALGAKRR